MLNILNVTVARRWPGWGHLRATVVTDDRFLMLISRWNRTLNDTHLRRHFLLSTERIVSSQTVQIRLHQDGLCARRSVVCIRSFTSTISVVWRRWAAKHWDWAQRYWSQVLFTDGSRMSQERDTRHALIGREKGVRRHVGSQYKQGRLVVCGAISTSGRADLHIIQIGTLRVQMYANEIVKTSCRTLRGSHWRFFSFNTRSHTDWV